MLAVITGGMSKLGVVMAARLAAAGYDLALHMRRDRSLDADFAGMVAAADVNVAVFPAELGDPGAVESLIPRIATHFGRAPTLLVNSASMLSEGGWDQADDAALVDHFRVNTVAPLVLIRQFAACVAPGARGAVINILDQRIINPPIDQASYTLSKLALAAATRSLARAFAPSLRVNAIAPGLTIPGPEYAAAQVAYLADLMPLGRLPDPDDVAEAIVYLAGAKAVTGQILFVDGGASLESYPRDFVHMGL